MRIPSNKQYLLIELENWYNQTVFPLIYCDAKDNDKSTLVLFNHKKEKSPERYNDKTERASACIGIIIN